VTEIAGLRLAPNWTSAAGALEGVLAFLGAPLPRHAVMGLTGLAWHSCLGTAGEVAALPSGPADLDWELMCRRFALTGFGWERFGATLPPGEPWDDMRGAAIDWAIERLDRGVPLIGWDFHLHEFGIVYGYDRQRAGFLVEDVVSGQVGPLALWADWPTPLGRIELFAPGPPVDVDGGEAAVDSLAFALECFAGRDGPDDGQPRGTAALEAWAEALDGDGEVDRAGNAYTLAVLEAARMDGAQFLGDLANALPQAEGSLRQAERAARDEAGALSPLITLFPFPTGGHGNVANAGLRRAAAMALRRAASHERGIGEAIEQALAELEASAG
jgi:hypothetical protein